jgi:hypothetical protein
VTGAAQAAPIRLAARRQRPADPHTPQSERERVPLFVPGYLSQNSILFGTVLLYSNLSALLPFSVLILF